MTDSRVIVVMGDVGDAVFHVGDEAMLAENLHHLRRNERTPEIRVLGRGARAADIADALVGASGLLISGGGNLSNSWPALLEQRLLVMREAARLGLPTVLGGQTIGPQLTPPQRHALAQLLPQCALVGVREIPSAAQALALGVAADRIVYQVDDAFGLADAAPAATEVSCGDRPFLAVTLDASFGTLQADHELRVIGLQLAAAARELGVRIVFVPHLGRFGRIDSGDGDVGGRLAHVLAHQDVECQLLPVLDPGQCAELTRRASAVVSSRYHPLVFASGRGVPAVAVYRDTYTRIKLEGALAHVGMARWVISTGEAERGHLIGALRRLWRERDNLRQTALEARPGIEQRETERWLRIQAALSLASSTRGVDQNNTARLGWPPGALAGSALDAVARDQAALAPDSGPGLTAPIGCLGAMPVITDEQWDVYARQGYLDLGRVLSPEAVEDLQQRADDVAQGLVRNDHLQMQLDTGGAYEELPEAVGAFPHATKLYRKIQGLESDELFRPLVTHPLCLEVCAHEYGPHAPVSIFRAMVMNKPAGQGTHLPWHQDGGDVWALDHDPLVTIWIALDGATRENGCMEAIPGSHRLGLLSAAGSNLSAADVQHHCDPARVVPLEVESGHAILLHNWLIHRSGVNPSAKPRRAVTVCYLDGRTRSVLTGDHFPLVAGEVDPALPHYAAEIQRDRAAVRESFARAEEYVHSLERELARFGSSSARRRLRAIFGR